MRKRMPPNSASITSRLSQILPDAPTHQPCRFPRNSRLVVGAPLIQNALLTILMMRVAMVWHELMVAKRNSTVP